MDIVGSECFRVHTAMWDQSGLQVTCTTPPAGPLTLKSVAGRRAKKSLQWACFVRVINNVIFSSRLPEPEEKIPQAPLSTQTLPTPPLKSTLPLRPGGLALACFCAERG